MTVYFCKYCSDYKACVSQAEVCGNCTSLVGKTICEEIGCLYCPNGICLSIDFLILFTTYK